MTMNESTNDQDTLTAIAYPLYNGIAAYTVESACWGAYFLLFTCATFLLCTILWVLNFLYALLRVQGTLINAGPTLTLAKKVERTQNMYLNPLALPMEGLWLLNTVIVNGSALNSLEAGRALEVPASAEDNVVAQGISKVEQGMANEEDRKV
ncbi:hypothetical protein D9758_013078 [Tetrapyrgos nigripes]|uniref:Uncharacterized protein n=1 Tax=Tetrapyrgos nigripes TaxID=182062 RepID=A0A8H5CPQ8_9AGAR|nr:hypothetical protein D9758_013078 [Tetrapyrgos nigripes]